MKNKPCLQFTIQLELLMRELHRLREKMVEHWSDETCDVKLSLSMDYETFESGGNVLTLTLKTGLGVIVQDFPSVGDLVFHLQQWADSRGLDWDWTNCEFEKAYRDVTLANFRS